LTPAQSWQQPGHPFFQGVSCIRRHPARRYADSGGAGGKDHPHQSLSAPDAPPARGGELELSEEIAWDEPKGNEVW